jgi:hypothetical protein
VDFSRVSIGEIVAGVSGLMLLIVMFLPWFGGKATIELPGIGTISTSPSDTANAWESFTVIDLILFVVAVLAIGMLIARAAGAATAETVAPPGLIVGAAGVLAVILILYRLIDTPGEVHVPGAAVSHDITRELGIFLGLIAALGIAFGGYAAMNERASRQAPSA